VNRESVAGTATRLRDGRSEAQIPAGARNVYFLLKRPSSLPFNAYWGQTDLGLMLATQLERRLRISGAITLIPYTSLWRGQGQLFKINDYFDFC
jgi:hypothetical protein